MTEGRMIKGYKVHESPVPGKLNKFLIREDQAWFLAMEDRSQLKFAEIFPEFFDLSDKEALDSEEKALEDGRALFGYVLKETGEVEVHNWFSDDGNIEEVKKRLREVFPHAEYFEDADRKRFQL